MQISNITLCTSIHTWSSWLCACMYSMCVYVCMYVQHVCICVHAPRVCTYLYVLYVCHMCVYLCVLYDFVCHLCVHLFVWSAWVCGQWTFHWHWVIGGNTSRLKTKQKLVLSLLLSFLEGKGCCHAHELQSRNEKKKSKKKRERHCFHFVWRWNPTLLHFHHPKVHLCRWQPCISSYPKQQREGSRVLVTQALQPVRLSVTTSIVREKPQVVTRVLVNQTLQPVRLSWSRCHNQYSAWKASSGLVTMVLRLSWSQCHNQYSAWKASSGLVTQALQPVTLCHNQYSAWKASSGHQGASHLNTSASHSVFCTKSLKWSLGR